MPFSAVRPFRSLPLIALAVVLGAILLVSDPAHAQAPDPTLERGMKPYGSFEGGAIDSVSMTNGDLNIHIPLISYPQRGGKLHLGFYVKYFNNSYVHIPKSAAGCNVTRPPNCEYGDDVLGPWLGIVDDFSLSASANANPPPGYPPSGSITTPDGSSHELGLTTNGWRSTDATGYLCLNNCATVIDRDGVRYASFTASYAPTKIEDPNGNFITGIANANGGITSWTDTMGRTIPASTTTTDFSACTGTLPTVSASLWSLPGYQGGQMVYKICYANVSYGGQDCILANSTLNCTIRDTTVALIQSIVLPNNTAWTFQYDSDNPASPTGKTGNLLQITFPTGGYIKYTWIAVYICQTPTATTTTTYTFAVATRTVNANDGTGDHVWSYNVPNVLASNNSPYTVTSTDPLGQSTVHTLSALGGACSFYETQMQTKDATGNILKTVATDYHAESDPLYVGTSAPTASSNVVPIRVTTTWPNGQVSKVETDYDAGVALTGSLSSRNVLYGIPIAKREYDFGNGTPGGLIRTTTTTYQALTNANYLSNNFLTLPATIAVTDGVGVQRSSTSYTYDSLVLGTSGVTLQHEAAPSGTFRGNPTNVSRWLNTPLGTLNTVTNFFDTGTVQQITDPGGHVTSLQYSGTFYGAYSTQATNALTQSTSKNYDLNTGLLTSVTDPNNLITSYAYDNMWRLTQVNHPDGGLDTISRQESSFPFTTTRTKKMNATQNIVTTSVFDGLGRVTQTQVTSDPQGTIYSDTTYDALGRVATVSNPHRAAGDSTSSPGTTTYSYDALGRKTTVTYPDSSVLTTAYCGGSTLVTDPVGKWRRSRTDGLGRLVEVDEPNSSTATVAATGCPATGEPIWVTTYTNDTLGNLTNVVQNGSRQRTFTYDSLSRLLTSNNPETGLITYTYSPDGLVLTKNDARNITTTSTYDALHREKTRAYSNGDPSISINYDEAACLGLTACSNIGQRTSMTDAAGSESWAYQIDVTNLRTVHKEQRTTSSITKTATYYLDLAGNLTSVVYPTGRTVNYTYDSAARPSTAVDAISGITYATAPATPLSSCLTGAVCYTPQGSVYSMSIGQSSSFTGLNVAETFNTRLQPIEVKASSTAGNAMDLTYSFVDPTTAKNAGHVFGITNNLDSTRSQTFSYDQLNRITAAQTTSTFATSPGHCWGETYSVDAWGNLQTIAATTSSSYTGCSQESGFTKTADASNHLSGFSYDLSGNTANDGTNSYVWDGESQLKSAGGVNYLYDGDGRRASKSNGKLYWYGSGGEILAETNAAGAVTAEYIFFGGKRIAMLPAGSTAQFYAEDFLGSSRVITTNTGAVCYDADFYPYGGERTLTNTCTQNAYKFEGKERDSETGNDDFGARYYSNRFGRWLSADWSAIPVAVPYANLTNPQTLNLYSMVSDDPESFADLDGHLQFSPANSPCSQEHQTECNNAQQQQTQAAQTTQPQETGSVFVLNIEAGGEIGAETKVGPLSAGLSASAGVEADIPNQSAEVSVKVNADIKAGHAQLGAEGKLGVATLDKDGLHAEFKPSASLGLGGEKKTFGSGAKDDTDQGFIVSGTIKAGVVKVEAGVNLTALKDRAVQALEAAKRFFSLDFRGPVPRYVPPGP